MMCTGRKASAAAFRKTVIIVLLLAFLPLLSSGCSPFEKLAQTTKRITRDVTGRGDKYRKKVAITLFENKTFLDTATFQEEFQRELAADLEKACPENIFLKPGDALYPAFLSNPLRKPSGQVDNFALATSARDLGINATVFGGFISIKTNQRMKGFMWFKEPKPMVKLNLAARAYDSETGAILFDETYEQEFEVDEGMVEEIQNKRPAASEAFKEPFKRLAGSISEKICDAISAQPWEGYIISVTGDKVVLSSGRDSKLLLGDVLDVYDSGKTIEGMDGVKFYLPGAKVGEVKISGIFAKRSEAIIISGKQIKPGDTVKPR